MSRVEVKFDGVSRGAVAAASETKAAIRGVGDQASRETSRTKGFSGVLGGLGKTAFLAAGAAGLGAVVSVLKTGFAELAESQKVAAQTAAVIKSTGQEAGITAKAVEELAGAISKKTGIDDEAIQSAENVLLTFTAVRNEAGRGNDVFTRATKVITDMSVALGQDLQSSTIQVGKALNDPIKGISALQRVGVSFTADQKELIKSLVETGDTMGAQKIILAELNKEFGGSAEAFGQTLPGQVAKARNSFEELAGKIAEQLLPAVTRVLQETTKLIEWVSDNFPKFQQVVKTVFDKIKPVIDGFVKEIRGFVEIIRGIVNGDWSKVWDGLKKVVSGALDAAIAIIRGLFDVWKRVLGRLADSAVEGLKDGLAALAGVVRDAVGRALDAIRNLIDDAGRAATNLGRKILNGIGDGLTGIAVAVRDRVSGAIDTVVGLGERAYGAAKGLAGRILRGIVDGLAGLGGALLDLVRGPINRVIGAINAIKIPGFSINIPDVGAVKIAGKTVFPGIPIPDINFGGVDPIPDIPLLGEGGIVTRPTIAMIGEAGPEAVIPLDRRIAPQVTVNVNVNGPVANARQFARDIAPLMKAELARVVQYGVA